MDLEKSLMGYMRHHAIVVTSWDSALGVKAHREVRRIGSQFGGSLGHGQPCDILVSPLTEGLINGQVSFLVAPDGSKEGWEDSRIGDAFRDAVVAYLRSLAYDDGSTSVEWCLVQFGDDNDVNYMVDDSSRTPARSR